MLLLLAKV